MSTTSASAGARADVAQLIGPRATRRLRAERRSLVARAEGRVLDLGAADLDIALFGGAVTQVVAVEPVPERRARLARAHPSVILVDDVDDAVGPFDTVVSVLGLASAADPERVLDAARVRLAADGTLRFLEVSRTVGALARVQDACARSIARSVGVWVDRDITALVRSRDLVIHHQERLTMPTVALPARTFVRGTARARVRQ